jgi:hypothetical protein
MTVRPALATRLHPARLRARAHPVEKVRSHLKRNLANLAKAQARMQFTDGLFKSSGYRLRSHLDPRSSVYFFKSK